jgi:hypothetical protein
MHDIDVFKISTQFEPRLMALKQILQLGLKFIDAETIRQNRYKLSNKEFKGRRFMTSFYEEFLKLDPVDKRFIIDKLADKKLSLKKRILSIKNRLKSHYRKISIIGSIPNKKILRRIIYIKIYMFDLFLKSVRRLCR